MEFIAEYHEIHTYPPTYTEIGRQINLAPSAVKGEIDILKAMGLVYYLNYKSRTLQITPKGEAFLRLLEADNGAKIR